VCLVLGCSQKLVTEVEKVAKKCHTCLDVKKNIQETTLDETWIDIEGEFPLQSKPDITRGPGMKNRARSIESRSIEKQWLRYGRKEIFKKREFFQIKC
jgi:hypothetical protein